MTSVLKEQDFELLFENDEARVAQFVEEHRDSLNNYADDILQDDSYTLADKTQALFSAVYGVVVDWREYDDEIVKLFGQAMPDEDVAVECTDQGLLVTYNGVQHPITLTFSPADRYVTIRGFQSIIGDKYEIRLLERSYYSDTHEFIVLPREQWARLEQRYGNKLSEVFRIVDEELDFP